MKVFLFLISFVFLQSLAAKDSITVYIFMLDECPICQEASAELNALYKARPEKVGFLGIFPNFVSKPANIDAFKKKYGIAFPTKTDYTKTLTKKFGATVMPEVVVYNEKSKKILYRGLIDDRYISPSKRKYHVAFTYLRDVLSAINANKPILTRSTVPVGCIIEQKTL